MTIEQWKSLEVGSIVSNKQGKNFRVVIEILPNGIKLLSNVKRGYVCYIIGDRSNFILKGKIRKK